MELILRKGKDFFFFMLELMDPRFELLFVFFIVFISLRLTDFHQ